MAKKAVSLSKKRAETYSARLRGIGITTGPIRYQDVPISLTQRGDAGYVMLPEYVFQELLHRLEAAEKVRSALDAFIRR